VIGGAFIGLPSAVSRFMLAPAAVLSLVGGVGLAEAVRTFRPGRPRLAAAGVLAVATLAFAVPRLAAVADQAQPRWGNRDDRRKVITVLQRADAKARFARCHGEIAVVKWSPFQVAWRLRVSVSTVRVWKPGEPPLRRGLLFLKSAKDFPTNLPSSLT
jgi:hypothetical protein